MDKQIENTIIELGELDKAIIDSSSIIYMDNANFLNIAFDNLELCTAIEVLDEIDFDLNNIQLFIHEYSNMPTDNILTSLAISEKLPIISEDKQILEVVKKNGLPYFNSLMILNYLLLKKIISKDSFAEFLNNLKKIAHYSDEVWTYGERVYKKILDII